MTGKEVEGVVFPEPHYETQKEAEELCYAPPGHVSAVGVVGSVGKGVEEEPVREH